MFCRVRRCKVGLLAALLVCTSSAYGQYSSSPAQEREQQNATIDRLKFWTALDSQLISNEFQIFSRIPFDYAGLKRNQQGMLVFLLKFAANGTVIDYAVQEKPVGKLDITPFIKALPRIRLSTPQGNNPFTPEFQARIGGEFYYFLFWPLYTHLPHGKPPLDEEFARWYNEFILRTKVGAQEYYNLIRVDSPPEPIKLNAWRNTVRFPNYGLSREISGKVEFEVVVDTLGQVIKHRMFPKTHAVYLYVIMSRLYELKFIPARLDGKPVMGVSRFTFTFTVR